jgi:coniferyl-aldehyde dehydrogenase
MTAAEHSAATIEPGHAPPLRRVLDVQRSAFAANPPGYGERIDALAALERAIVARQDDIVAAVSEDFGCRPAEETLGLELFPLLNEIRYARRHVRRWMAPRRAPVQWQFWPGRAVVHHRPLGVVGILSPWNYPIFLSLVPLTCAIAAGNHVVLKPSETAPASGRLLESLLSGLYPASYVSVVTGGPDVASEMVGLPFDHILFTGSTRVGRLVMKAASQNLVPVTLELGGKSPALVHPAYPIDRAAKKILTGKLYNAGQTCVAPDYALVPRGSAAAFADAAAREAARMYPSLTDGRYTRIINTDHYDRLTQLVDDATRRGATITELNASREACGRANRTFPPTLMTNVRDDMAIMQEEIFGPVLPVVEYGTLDEAIAYINGRPHPLALYYFDDDRGRADGVVGRVTAGGATVNDSLLHVGQTGLPFGGVGASGMGRYHGFDGFQTFSHKQGTFFQPRWSPVDLLRPPYGPAARRILERLIGRRAGG